MIIQHSPKHSNNQAFGLISAVGMNNLGQRLRIVKVHLKTVKDSNVIIYT